MSKYSLLRERLKRSERFSDDQFVEPQAASVQALRRVHDAAYVRQVFDGELDRQVQRRIGFPWSPQMVERSRRSVGGTMAAAEAALAEGIAVNLAGGTHHAYRDCGGGFCVFNDVMVAAAWLEATGQADKVVVVDLDVHQGDGTAAIAAELDWVFTFSMHGDKNYPARKQISDLDIALPDATTDAGYLNLLGQHLPTILDEQAPDVVFYLAGADPYEGDRLGRLALTKDGLLDRDKVVFDALKARGIPVVIVMAGGYAESVEDIVDIHFNTICAAKDFWLNKQSLQQ